MVWKSRSNDRPRSSPSPLRRPREQTGRNASERRAGLETRNVGADPPQKRGRPPSLGEWGVDPGQTHLICKSLAVKDLGIVLPRTLNCNFLSYNNLRTWCVSPGGGAGAAPL